MHVIEAKSTHHGLEQGLKYLDKHGITQSSRNGTAIVAPGPVTTVFQNPMHSVVWYPERDFNIAFLVYESLWMLEGRTDVLPLTRYVKRMIDYSDDGMTLRGSSYGHRWRHYFHQDQLLLVAKRLSENPQDRRSVIGMWDPATDLQIDNTLKDLPCNMIIAFQVTPAAELDMTVFNRSNDIIWGTYFANSFHFSMLHHYLADRTGYKIGRYFQISNNYHAYGSLFKKTLDYVSKGPSNHTDYYYGFELSTSLPCLPDSYRKMFLLKTDLEQLSEDPPSNPDPYYRVLMAHELYRRGNLSAALDIVNPSTREQWNNHHWIVSMRHWIQRRLGDES